MLLCYAVYDDIILLGSVTKTLFNEHRLHIYHIECRNNKSMIVVFKNYNVK